jgi:hypothetical protein
MSGRNTLTIYIERGSQGDAQDEGAAGDEAELELVAHK